MGISVYLCVLFFFGGKGGVYLLGGSFDRGAECQNLSLLLEEMPKTLSVWIPFFFFVWVKFGNITQVEISFLFFNGCRHFLLPGFFKMVLATKVLRMYNVSSSYPRVWLP